MKQHSPEVAAERTAELITAARACPLGTTALRALGLRLPGDDDLARLFDEVVEARYDHAFTALALAALDGGRPVDASVLKRGAELLPDPGVLAKLVGHVSGDVASPLIEAVREGRMGWEREAVALFLAAWWCRRETGEFPHGLSTEVRVLARKPIGIESRLFLLATGDLLDDSVILGLLGSPDDSFLRQHARGVGDRFAAVADRPVLDGLDEHPVRVGSPGRTVRRSVEKISRNAPCPCGSGAKYKKCCEARDRDRLRDSSDVPGVTQSELRTRPEPYLTPDRLLGMRSFEVVRLDPLQVDPSLHALLLVRLDLFGEVRAIAELFARVGWREKLDGHLIDAVHTATERGEHDIARQLIAMRPADLEADLDLAAQLVVDELEPGPMLRAIEDAARASLEKGGDVDLAHSLLSSSLPALGILVGRGSIATAHPFEAEVLLERVLECRDRLELAPDDPAEAIFDVMNAVWSPETASDSSGADEDHLQARQQELDAAQTEVRRLREEVRRLNETASETPSGPSVAPDAPGSQSGGRPESAADDPAALEVRKRLADTREQLKQRHAERNLLRRELDQARREMERLRAAEPVAASAAKESDREEMLLLEEDTVEVQPVRLISHARGFSDQLASVPRPTARATLRLAGRLAAGDLSAFRGSRRLRLDRTLWRQRVGISHRLLFRLHPQELELLALIDRRDLEKTIKRLAS